MTLRTLYFLVTILFGIACGNSWGANNLILEQSYYEDPSSLQSFSDIQGRKFKSFIGALNKGYSDSAFWVRIKIDSSELKDREKFAIRITPSYLDEMKIYQKGDLHELAVVGDRYSQSNNAESSLGYSFISENQPSSPYYWIRLKTTSTSLMNIEVMSLKELNYVTAVEYMFSGLLFGLLCAAFVIGLVYYLGRMELFNGAFLLLQASALLCSFTYFGYARLLFSNTFEPSFIDRATSLFILIYMLATLYFYSCFYQEYKPRRWVKIFFASSICTVFVALGLFAFYGVREAMHLNMIVVAISSLALFCIPIFGLRWSEISNPILQKNVLVLTQSVTLLVVIYTALSSLGIISASKISAYLVMLNTVITSIVMLLVVRYRAIKLDQQRIEEISSERSRADYQKEQRQRQSEFMSMLIHELRTPLSVIQYAVRTALGSDKAGMRVDKAVADMSAVIERCQQADQIEAGLGVKKMTIDLSDFLSEFICSEVEYSRVSISQMAKDEMYTDPILLKVILGNLIDNALKYSPPSDWIYLDVDRSPKGEFIFSIKNSILPEVNIDQEKIFSKYYRGEYAHSKTGSGLGLYIVKALVNLLNGSISYSRIEGYVIFSVELPA